MLVGWLLIDLLVSVPGFYLGSDESTGERDYLFFCDLRCQKVSVRSSHDPTLLRCSFAFVSEKRSTPPGGVS